MIAIVAAALRARWGAYAMIAALACGIGALAAVGAAYPRTVADRIAAAEISTAPLADRSFLLTADKLGGGEGTFQNLAETARALPDFTTVYGASFQVFGVDPKLPAVLMYREGFCARVHLTAGRCPRGAGEVIVPASDADRLHETVGTRLDLLEAQLGEKGQALPGDLGTQPVDVVGVYEPIDPGSDYWGVQRVFGADARLGTRGPLLTLPDTLGIVPHAAEGYTMDVQPGRSLLITGDWAALEHRVGSGSIVLTGKGLPELMGRIAAKRTFVEIMTPAVVLPVLGLGCWVLFLAIGTRVRADGPESGLSALRGLPVGRRWWLAVGAPLTAVTIATPLGALAAAIATGGFDTEMLRAAGLAYAAEVVVIILATSGPLRSGLADTLRRLSSPRGLRFPVLEVLLLALTAASLAQHASGDTTGIGIFAPTLLAVSLAVIAARLLAVLARPLAGGSLRRGRLVRGLALVVLTRRPSGRQLLALTGAVTALFALVVSAVNVAATARDSQVMLSVGSARVLKVQGDAAQVLTAVRTLDPDGKYAVAAGTIGTGSGTLAVDLSRSGLIDWPEAGRVGTAAGAATDSGEAVQPGAEVLLRAVTNVPGAASPKASIVLSMAVETSKHTFRDLSLGVLRKGTATYTGRVPDECEGGCRIAGLWAVALGGGAWAEVSLETLTVGGRKADLSGWHLPGQTGDPMAWSIGDLASAPSSWMLPADVPVQLPVAYARADEATLKMLVLPIRGADRQGTPVTGAVAEQALPRIGTQGVLLDLETALRASVGGVYTTGMQVWLTADAPADVADRLTALGVPVVGQEDRAAVQAAADGTPAALTLRMQMLAVLVALVLLVVALTSAAAGDRRMPELAALRVAGLPERTVRRAVRRAHLFVLAAGVPLGLAAAAVAWAVARSALPIVEGTPWLPVPGWPAPASVLPPLIGAVALPALAIYLVFAGRRTSSARPLKEKK
ncbi:hypothetical protein [Hamadaea tsunoensis]|uniref:hypothetical protein n=1 Tax=Hamadaea tsunoensis TaxID=53368 RepID=UPI0003FA8B18|nr:hypothetical protein [Hamadaea tsunoensis]